jgi:hypothetical protein
MVQYPSNGGGYRDLPKDAPPPRLCLIQKTDSSQEYGFNLHAEKKGQFIGAVDAGSPADLAGLKQGDRIFAVNGASIIGVPHKTVVSWIKSDPLKCEMLVISEDDYQWYAENNIPIDMSMPNIIRVCKEVGFIFYFCYTFFYNCFFSVPHPKCLKAVFFLFPPYVKEKFMFLFFLFLCCHAG